MAAPRPDAYNQFQQTSKMCQEMVNEADLLLPQSGKRDAKAFSFGEAFPIKPPQMMATDPPNLPALRNETQILQTL